jgi:hypothetical protein
LVLRVVVGNRCEDTNLIDMQRQIDKYNKSIYDVAYKISIFTRS